MPVAQQLMTSARDDWQTPECVLERVRQVADIGLDPCPGANGNHVGAANVAKGNGLALPWRPMVQADELVYVNPPYGIAILEWMRKCAFEARYGVEIVALVPARTDTRWFSIIWRTSQAVCFWRGRLTFVGAKDSAPFPSAVAYWGSCIHDFMEAFGPAGKVVLP